MTPNLMTQFSLQGEIALVTGGATGIGGAIAVALAEAGADVVVTVNQRPATDTEKSVKELGRKFLAVPRDLATLTKDTAETMLNEIQNTLGSVTILVNNAGIIRRSPAKDFKHENWQMVMNVNLESVWTLSQVAGQRMLEKQHGKIINIASLLSFQGGVNVLPYTASKHAVAGLTKALANEWSSQGINVNAIAPGYIRTENTQALQQDETRSRQILERIPVGRWGEAQDIAGAAVFLASKAANYIHGHILAVDGGWLAR
ncbi:MAG: 2-dehydro-3-deoxy-D-gluconate 5-dehydrogenase KduD [Trueperaceae bacterium]